MNVRLNGFWKKMLCITFQSIITTIEKMFLQKNKPNLLIANTVKGKGVPFMENRFESHYEVLDKKQYQEAIEKLK